MKGQVERFIRDWAHDAAGVKPVFMTFLQELVNQADTRLEFYERPGVSYSLRGAHAKQDRRPLFVMVDVIDDDPGQRWLSVCFYGDMIEDPESLGDLIPEGLLGDDGTCFDIDKADAHLERYVSQRIREAAENAAGGHGGQRRHHDIQHHGTA